MTARAKTISNPKSSFASAPSGVLQRKCDCGAKTLGAEKCTKCSTEGMMDRAVQRKSISAGDVDGMTPIVHDALRSSGQRLNPDSNAFGRLRFGHDFSQTRAHSDAKDAESSSEVNTLTTTVGPDTAIDANKRARTKSSIERGGLLQRKCACGGTPGPSGECAECEKKQKKLQRKAIDPSRAGIGISPSRIPILQPKLTIGASNDPLEQEADRVADEVLAAPTHPAVSAAPPRIQRISGQPNGQTEAAPASVDRVLAHAGSPLNRALQQDMEMRFGHDFSHVRVHFGAAAEQSAREVNADAYTVGSSIVFGAGRFVPSTHEGRRLIAHELTHVVQQAGTEGIRSDRGDDKRGVPPISRKLQRSLGFEFQTSNIVKTNRDRLFGRKSHKFFHKGKTGVELQSDTGSVVEFETKPLRRWTELEAQIQEATDICRALNDTFGAQPAFAWTDEHRASKLFTFSEEQRIRKEEPLAKGENVVVEVKQPNFAAKVQSTEGVALSQYESLLKEHEKREIIDPVISSAQKVLDSAKNANTKITTGANTNNLRGFLQVIINYIQRGQNVHVPVGGEDWQPVKATFRLMSRTNFSSMYRSLLSPDEKTLFDQIVKSNAIPNELNIKATDPFFSGGYWGHHGAMMALFKGGKIVALANENKKGSVYDCTSKLKPSGLNVSACGTSVAAANITVGSWLMGIITAESDPLSPPSQGSESMGKHDVRTRGDEKGLVLFEARGTRREAGQKDGLPLNKWVSYAEEVFKYASFCRERPESATALIYDGSDRFSWNKCVPPK